MTTAFLPRLLPAVVALPLVFLWPVTPDAVLINQLLAVGLCGLLPFTLSTTDGAKISSGPRDTLILLVLWLLLGLGIVLGRQAAGPSLGEAGVWTASLVVLFVARWHAAHPSALPSAQRGWALGWWIAGSLCALVALGQYFLPPLADGSAAGRSLASVLDHLIASTTPGRAVGNMRQPNHLATALLCAMVMTAWLWQARRLPAWVAAGSLLAMVLGVALSASRTGALSLGVLVLWALVDSRLPRAARWLLGLTPLIYAIFWAGLAEYAALQQSHFYGADRLQSSSDISSSRFAIWKNSLELIAQNPWTGVGWGRFNFAWTFTPFPDRPVAFFDHTHNLLLQLAVEIGIPATVAVLALLLWALWRARGALGEGASRAAAPDAPDAAPARAAFAMLAVLAVHSLLEYPLWYAYFLMPAAWALGTFLGAAPVPQAADGAERSASPWPTVLLKLAGVLMVIGAGYAAWDHRRVEEIYAPSAGAGPLDQRIAEGQRSRLFGHHADYAAVTNEPIDQRLATFRRPLQQLVDVRLLIAYIEALKANGRDADALYAAQRLREFRRDDAQAYFKDCDSPAPPFQCDTRPVPLTWRDLLP